MFLLFLVLEGARRIIGCLLPTVAGLLLAYGLFGQYVPGRLRGGAAKESVLSSALFGSISGSASVNVASTGGNRAGFDWGEQAEGRNERHGAGHWPVCCSAGMIANPDIIALKHVPVGAVVAFVQMALGLACLSFGIISNLNGLARLALVGVGFGVIFLRVLI